jgi:hypothetical protein
MRWLRNRSWLQRPWLWGFAGLCLLNLWAGCSEQPPKGPAKQTVSKVEPSVVKDETSKVETPPEKIAATDPPEQEVEVAKKEETPAYGESEKPAEGTKPVYKDLFEDWPEPVALLLLSGDQRGYIEPCGCAGLENQKGGLKRRHTFVKQMNERGWPLALFDLGEQVKRFGVQQEIKFKTAIQSLDKIGYKAVGFGPDDLQLPAELMLLLELPEGQPSPFVSANVTSDYAPEMIAPYKVVTVGNKKIGVTSILGAQYQDLVHNEGIKIRPAAEALAEVLPKMQAEADYFVLLSNSTLEEAIALGQKFQAFNLVVTASGADEPPLDVRPIEGTKQTYLVDLGSKGMFLAAIGLYDDPNMPLRYKPIPLDKRFEDSPEMQTLFKAYQRHLKVIGLKGLNLNRRAPANKSEFVGSKECATCHTKAFAIWEKTPHAHATDTLTKLDPARQFDAECLSCHVTGWELNPGTYVPYLTGYYDDPATPHLVGNGCENCHGAGSAHVKAESGEVEADEKTLTALREQMRLPLEKAEATCVKCHDHDNSPEFDTKGFAEYWKHVEHKGKD